jgi:hypothetical protein
MITVGFSTRQDNQGFIAYLKNTSGVEIEVIQKINNGEKSLSETYNEILNESSNDIVILCHDDIIIETKNWGKNILKNFNDNPEYGVIGMAGGVYMPETGKWWEQPITMRGIVNHQKDDKKWESKYSNSVNGLSEVLIVDGVFISLDKTKIKKQFDSDMPGFHFYDLSFSFSNYLSGVKVGVMYNVRITHLSLGETNDQWEENRKLFIEKYKDNLNSKIEEDGDITTFVMCHDQEIIKANITSGKFNQLGLVKFMYVGKGEFTELDQYPQVTVVRDLKYNIEQYPAFTAFTAWYAIWRHQLCKTKYINLLEYDVNLKDDYGFFLKNIIKKGPKIVGYFPLSMRNYHFVQNRDWVTSIMKGIKLVYKMDMLFNVAQVIQAYMQAKQEPYWPTTNNVCMDRLTFEKYMKWVAPLITYMKDDPYSGHNQERGISFFSIINKIPVAFFQGYIEHVQADSHKTQGHEVTKEIQL